MILVCYLKINNLSSFDYLTLCLSELGQKYNFPTNYQSKAKKKRFWSRMHKYVKKRER